ncbi:MAG: hypothetical protein NTV79_08155 [Candidatus Aureabacteria bacterium]|nr:hypothetical protein [Candidatus Auribacterota bacterium]
MNAPNENRKQADNGELLKQEAPACGPGCGCQGAKPSKRIRVFLGAIILVAAAILAARALMKDNVVSADTAAAGFASVPAMGQAAAPDGNVAPAANEAPAGVDSVVEKEIGALADLNAVAAATDGVFVYLPGRNDAPMKAPLTPMRSAARTIESQARVKIGLFTLKTTSRDYEQIAAQMTVPGVLAMVKGRGMVPVTGEITETKLVQGFVAASSAGGCGPSAKSGCCPR